MAHGNVYADDVANKVYARFVCKALIKNQTLILYSLTQHIVKLKCLSKRFAQRVVKNISWHAPDCSANVMIAIYMANK